MPARVAYRLDSIFKGKNHLSQLLGRTRNSVIAWPRSYEKIVLSWTVSRENLAKNSPQGYDYAGKPEKNTKNTEQTTLELICKIGN